MSADETLMNDAFEVIKKLESGNESDELTEISKEVLIEMVRAWTRPRPTSNLIPIDVPYADPIYMDFLYKDETDEQH